MSPGFEEHEGRKALNTFISQAEEISVFRCGATATTAARKTGGNRK
jgi:hypothetical protein